MKVNTESKHPIKMWTDYVPVEAEALTQLKNLAGLPFIHKHIAVMPDVHLGKGATVGSVIPTYKAVIPAAVGVDIGCGMCAVKTDLTADDMPDNLFALRCAIEERVPVGFSMHETDAAGQEYLKPLLEGYASLDEGLRQPADFKQIGTLGGGNHFIEICLDEDGSVWIMLHSGSRGIGNRIGRKYIEKAKMDMEKYFITLPDEDLAYIPQNSEHFHGYMKHLNWAQKYASLNRKAMLDLVSDALAKTVKPFKTVDKAINCHHNYISQEHHFNKNVFVTRKGAVSAREGELGIIPGSMGERSFIVRGKGNAQSFCSCSHGAGRLMSRTEAKQTFTLEQHASDTASVECRKDEDIMDETPRAYKRIDDVMRSQSDLVDVVATLKQIVCVKG